MLKPYSLNTLKHFSDDLELIVVPKDGIIYWQGDPFEHFHAFIFG